MPFRGTTLIGITELASADGIETYWRRSCQFGGLHQFLSVLPINRRSFFTALYRFITLSIHHSTDPWLYRSITLPIHHSTDPSLCRSIALLINHSAYSSLFTSITLPIHHSINPSLYRSSTLPIHHSTDPSLHQSITLLIHHSTYSSLYPSITLPIHHSIDPSLYRSITLSIHQISQCQMISHRLQFAALMAHFDSRSPRKLTKSDRFVPLSNPEFAPIHV